MNNSTKTNSNKSSLAIFLILVFPLSFFYTFLTGAPFLGVLTGNFFVMLSLYSLVQVCDSNYSKYILLIFVIKYALVVYQAINKDLPMGGVDWIHYHNNAKAMIENSGNILEALSYDNYDLFSKFVAILYNSFGAHTMYIYLFVFASSNVATKYVFKTALLLTDNDYEASSKAMMFFNLWPISIIYAVTFLREMPIQALVIVSFYNYVVYIKERKIVNLILSFLFIVFASMMHSGVIAIIAIYFMFLFRNKNNYELRIISPATIFLLLVAIVLLRVSPLWNMVSAKLGDVSSAEGLVKRSQQFVEGDASTRYVTEMPSNIAAFVLQVPWRAALFAIVPLPWMINSFETAFAWVVDAIPQIWLIWRLIKLNNLTKGTKNRIYYVVCVLSIIATYMVCGMGTTAYGNAIRHRAKIIPMILVFVVAVYEYLKKPKVEKQDESDD